MGLFWIWDCLIRNSIAHLGNVADLGNWSGLFKIVIRKLPAHHLFWIHFVKSKVMFLGRGIFFPQGAQLTKKIILRRQHDSTHWSIKTNSANHCHYYPHFSDISARILSVFFSYENIIKHKHRHKSKRTRNSSFLLYIWGKNLFYLKCSFLLLELFLTYFSLSVSVLWASDLNDTFLSATHDDSYALILVRVSTDTHSRGLAERGQEEEEENEQH